MTLNDDKLLFIESTEYIMDYVLQGMDDWSFDVFALNSAADGHSLKYVGYELLQKYDLVTKYKINSSMLDSFLLQLEAGYSKYKNPYHNLVHGADVTQTVHNILSQSKLAVSTKY